MSDSEFRTFNKPTAMGASEAAPLARGQRMAAAAIGTALAGAGATSVFVGENQAGSVALLLAGALFLLIAVSGMPILGAKLRDFELHFAMHRAQQVRNVAGRLPAGEAERLLRILEDASGGAFDEPLLALVESLLFEARVTNAVVSAIEEGERAEPHPDADVGEPLIVHVSPAQNIRIGVFNMSTPHPEGVWAPAFHDRFAEQFARSGCDAAIFVTCVRDGGGLAALASRIGEPGLPVAVEDWRSHDEGRSLRPAIERLSAEVRGARSDVPRQARGSESGFPEPAP